MKTIFVGIVALVLASASFAQMKTPVKWSYSAKKIADKTYELHITADIDNGWHIYSLDHKGDIGVATSIKINPNPLGMLDGKLATKAKAVSMKDPSTGEMVKFYTNAVDFVQVVKLKAAVKTNYTGSLEFMTCDDHECLPPTTKKFSIALQ
jgi:thiol:disulfide interchange protein DsbD